MYSTVRTVRVKSETGRRYKFSLPSVFLTNEKTSNKENRKVKLSLLAVDLNSIRTFAINSELRSNGGKGGVSRKLSFVSKREKSTPRLPRQIKHDSHCAILCSVVYHRSFNVSQIWATSVPRKPSAIPRKPFGIGSLKIRSIYPRWSSLGAADPR